MFFRVLTLARACDASPFTYKPCLILLNEIGIGFYGSPIFEVFMAGLLCKVKSQGSFWWVFYASPTIVQLELSEVINK